MSLEVKSQKEKSKKSKRAVNKGHKAQHEVTAHVTQQQPEREREERKIDRFMIY
jgi:hypothetical protein